MMKHAITTLALTLMALAWLTDPVSRVLALAWPVAALALMVTIACAALAASMWLIGRGLRELRPPAPKYEIIPREAAPVFAHDVAPARTAESGEPGQDYTDAYNQNVLLFLFIGNMRGTFSLKAMAEHCTDPAWRFYVGLLTARPHCVLIATKAGTWWAAGWTYGRVKAELNAGLLRLDYPCPTEPPPAVYWKRQRPTHAPHTHTTPNKRNKPRGEVWESRDGIVVRG
jgi:hypothetical protein